MISVFSRTCAMLSFLVSASNAADLLPLEAYGELPAISIMSLSPSGSRIAYRRVTETTDDVFVQELATGKLISGIDVSKVNPRALFFANEDRVILLASETTTTRFSPKAFDNSAAFVLRVDSNRVKQLMTNKKELYPAQAGLGIVVGRSSDKKFLYMPAFTGNIQNTPRYSLFKVSLDGRGETIVTRGSRDTTDWLIDADGRPLVEEFMDNENNIYRIRVRDGLKSTTIFEKKTDRPYFDIVGLSPDRISAVIRAISAETGQESLFLMSLEDGALSGALFTRDDASVTRTVMGIDRIVYGAQFSGFIPSYEFVDKELDARIRQIQSSNGGTAVYIADWTPGFETLLLRVSGGWNSGMYVLVSRENPEPQLVASIRPAIPPEFVVPTTVFEYSARDGLLIPALLTAKQQIRDEGGAPLIVLPHGGPASYDTFDFDWIAQYFASRGFVVLRPQFRGSNGFGQGFKEAGHGEWGGKMSTDLDDGVMKLVDDGLADASRVCMVGASYGGYAALAAGAFSAFDYKCLVSIAGVSDLPRMLKDARRTHGRNHWVVSYWREQFGSEEEERQALNAISPVRYAEAFKAPVLLVHGNKDTVVPIIQSTAMHKALKRAKRDVTLVKLDGEDHYLSDGETRIEALRVVAAFVEEHLQ